MAESTPTDSWVSSTATRDVAKPGAPLHRLSAQWTAGGEPHGRRSLLLHALSQVSVAVKCARRGSAVRGWPHWETSHVFEWSGPTP